MFDTLEVTARSEPHQSPFFYILAHYWMRLIGSSLGSMRALATLLSLFAIPGMYWLSLELFKSQKTALVSAALISLSPFSILMSQNARAYSLLSSMTLLSSAALMTAIRKNKKFTWGIYSLSLIVGIYSHQLFALVAIAHGLYLFADKKSRLEGRFVWYLVASLIALLIFTPWLFQIFTHWERLMNTMQWSNYESSWFFYIHRWVKILASPFIDLYMGPEKIVPYILRIPVLLLTGYALFFLVLSTPKRTWAFLLLLIGVAVLPLLLSDLLRGGILSTQGRYLTAANVVIIPVVAHLLVSKLSIPRATPPFKWYLVTALLLTAQIGSVFNILQAETWWTTKLSMLDPQVEHVLNQDSYPLLIVGGLAPTDLGDILALSYSVDEDVRFKLYKEPTAVELPSGFSNIYWYHQTYRNFIDDESGNQFKATEVVPYVLWRIELPKQNMSLDEQQQR